MIQIGLTGWGDHPDVYRQETKSHEKLLDYSAHFPVVELDAAFYAIQPERNMKKWINETPPNFKFIVKAFQGITGHLRGESPFQSMEEMVDKYKASITPLLDANKLNMILVQFPPWFNCVKNNVDYIKELKESFIDLPVAIEFRHQSWYEPQYRSKTFQFLTNYEFIHSVCDEPQAGQGSIPLVPVATNKKHSLFRLHGRNVHGWLNPGDAQKWREVRYLYDYNEAELDEIVQVIHNLSSQSEHVTVLFNNNSGGHAANNAKQIMKKLHIQYEGLNPKQLDIFEGDLEWNT